MKRLAACAIGVALVAATACGASVSAVYEGDVRFERCMALDWQVQVAPKIRLGCWEEWSRYFTRGQTRDRTEYAALQIGKLRSTEGGNEGVKPISQVPEPTNVFAPPPMLMGDAGPGAASASVDGGVTPPSPKSACETTCDERASQCQELCRGPVCDKSCAAKHSRCMQRCP